ncbi:MAG: hypothetical protein ACO39G_05030 [Flavobacteriaceae bacterium]
MSKNLKYYKQILHKVSFDASLFKKELKKAYRSLAPKERSILFSWLQEYTAERT